MDTTALAAHLAAGRFDDAAALVGSYTVPLVTERETDFMVHDLAADGSQVLAGIFEPIGPRVMIDVESAFAMVGCSRGALLLYVGQPDTPGETLYDCGGKSLPGVELHSVASVCGDSPWAATASRRLVFDVDPAKPVTWQILAAIIGPAAITPVPGCSQIAITPDGTRAFVTSPTEGTVTPIDLGRPLHVYDATKRPDDVAAPPVRTGAGATHVAADDAHAVVTNADDPDAQVTVLDARTGEITHQVRLDALQPMGVAITPDGSTAIAGTTTGVVIAVDLAAGTARTAAIPGATTLRGVGIARDGSSAFLSDTAGGAVHRVSLPSLSVEATIDVGENPTVVRVAPDGQVWVLGRNDGAKGHLRRIDPATNEVAEDHVLPKTNPNDMAIVPVEGQTDELVRTAWTVYDEGYSEFYIGGPFTGQAHTWHTAAFADDDDGPSSLAVNDYGEIWVVRPSADFVWKWPGGRFLIRPGIFFGEYCSVAVYGAVQPG